MVMQKGRGGWDRGDSGMEEEYEGIERDETDFVSFIVIET